MVTPLSRPSCLTSPSDVTPLMTALTSSGMTSMDSVLRNNWPSQATRFAAAPQYQPTSRPAITPTMINTSR